MVKNKQGGNRHKKMARKNVKTAGNSIKMRYAGESEMYARVIKVYGQGNVDVLCNDKVVRLCVIRRKFRGRNRRDNNIVLNGMVLVGIREWEHLAAGKKPKVDLLYCYSGGQLEDLKRAKGFNHDILMDIDKQDDEEGGIVFTHNADMEDFLGETDNAIVKKNIGDSKTNNTETDDFDINFDDI